MKDNYINVVFCVDESGSMYRSLEDVVGGFKSVVDEQKRVKEGKCTISLYTFASDVREIYLGKDVNEIEGIDYYPCGNTAMNDGIGTAIDKVGKWLSDMKEEDRPSKTLFVIMTDGEENSSTEYTLKQVQDMIKHQTEKYNWDFMYIGTDITKSEAAQSLGITRMSFSSRKNYFKNYDMLNCAISSYKCASSLADADADMDSCLTRMSSEITDEYEQELGRKID